MTSDTQILHNLYKKKDLIQKGLNVSVTRINTGSGYTKCC